MKYVAKDGKMFEEAEACQEYEELIDREETEKKKLMKQIQEARKALAKLEKQYVDEYVSEEEIEEANDFFGDLLRFILSM